MLKINEITVGQRITGKAIAVKSAEVRQTKSKKDYYLLTLTDGKDTITANMWDTMGCSLPAPNSIIEVNANVTEYAGNKQLTITTFLMSSRYTLADFIADSGVDTEELWDNIGCMIDSMENDLLADFTHSILQAYSNELTTAPGAKTIHNAYTGGLLEHMHDVAEIAINMCRSIPEANRDLVIAGALLHDLGKIHEYAQEGLSIETTVVGTLVPHLPLTSIMLDRFNQTASTKLPAKMLTLLQHVVYSHHGNLEWGSPVTPKCMEAFIVHFADNLDAKIGTLRELNKDCAKDLTEKSWVLGGQMVSQAYIAKIMK